MKSTTRMGAALALAMALATTSATAQVKIGVIASTTGPTAVVASPCVFHADGMPTIHSSVSPLSTI